MTLSDVIKVNKEAETPEEFLGIVIDRAYEIFDEVVSIRNEAKFYKDFILESMSLYDKLEENILAMMYACFIFGKDFEKNERMERWIQEQTKFLNEQSITSVFLDLRE